MLQQHTLHPHPGATRKRKRLGRGNSSGHGTTAGRGTKGQGSRTGRGKIRPWFEGGQTPLAQKMPKKKGFRRHQKVVSFAVNLAKLNTLDNGTVVTVESLIAQKIIGPKVTEVKILSEGELTKKLVVKVSCSAAAKTKIEAAGGKVETVTEPAKTAEAAPAEKK